MSKGCTTTRYDQSESCSEPASLPTTQNKVHVHVTLEWWWLEHEQNRPFITYVVHLHVTRLSFAPLDIHTWPLLLEMRRQISTYDERHYCVRAMFSEYRYWCWVLRKFHECWAYNKGLDTYIYIPDSSKLPRSIDESTFLWVHRKDNKERARSQERVLDSSVLSKAVFFPLSYRINIAIDHLTYPKIVKCILFWHLIASVASRQAFVPLILENSLMKQRHRSGLTM